MADQLAAIAAFFGFEGWLINIENPLTEPDFIDNLLLFLRCMDSLGGKLFGACRAEDWHPPAAMHYFTHPKRLGSLNLLQPLSKVAQEHPGTADTLPVKQRRTPKSLQYTSCMIRWSAAASPVMMPWRRPSMFPSHAAPDSNPVLSRHLTAAMRKHSPHSMVLWYDAVTMEGTLQWQDRLTDLNQPFFDACDGLFVNYTWQVCCCEC